MINIESGKNLIDRITGQCGSPRSSVSFDAIRDLNFAQGYFMAIYERHLGDEEIKKLFLKYGVNS